MVGICLIRLEQLRPRMLPEAVGLSSENAAHRIAVLWDDEQGVTHEGVFIPRRDTNSPVNYLLGGRLFPGEHHRADFDVRDTDVELSVSMKSLDGTVEVRVEGCRCDELPPSSIFPDLAASSAFFEGGSVGYSLTHDAGRLDGLRLATSDWRVEPLRIGSVYSSYFSDDARFPQGSVEFDHALIMRNIEHEWHNTADLYV